MPPSDEDRQRTWFVIAAYNEESVIRSVVTEVRSKYKNVVVVDDGSTDDTASEAEVAGAIIVAHPVNLGQGAAIQTGLAFTLRRDAKYIVTFDADGQHNVEDVDVMLDAMERAQCDVVLGSRFCGTAENIPLLRLLTLKAAISFTRTTTGLQLTDTHNGLRVLKAESAKRINLQQNGMAHASEFLEQIAHYGMSYVEVPVNIRYTEYSLQKGQRFSNSLNILMDLVIERFIK